MRSSGAREAALWLQPRQTTGLCAGGHRLGDHAGRVAAGRRGDGWQHQGQNHTEDVSEEDRATVWQGQPDLGHGPGDPDGGCSARDAGAIDPSHILGRDAAGTADASGKGVFETAVGQGERLSGSETLAAGGRDLHSGAQPGPETEGTWHTSAPAEEVVASPARVAKAETDTRRVVFENRMRQGGSLPFLSLGPSSFAQCAR